MIVQHKFIEFMPDIIEDGILYISLDYGTVIHNCACGCGSEVNTPLSPTGWEMIYNGEAVTLKPSVGNWSFDCKSHYWITNNNVVWSKKWSEDTIQKIRTIENSETQEYYRNKSSKNSDDDIETLIVKPESKPESKSWLRTLLFWK